LGDGPEVVRIAERGDATARRALESTIARGGLVVFPADTVYGIGCDPLSAAAIGRIHALKGREDRKPSAVLYFSPLAMRELVGGLGSRTRDVLAALLPGPVTLVVANREHRYPLACREDPERLGVRLIGGPLAGASCALFQTSANRGGEPAPRRLDDVDPVVLAGVDLAIDGGEVAGTPSSVLDITAVDSEPPRWRLLREGALPAAEIERLLAGIA
jgi:L-threonylcarbamoyladenylate synthase